MLTTIQTDRNDSEVNVFISALDTYLNNGKHCYLNSRSCEFRFTETTKDFQGQSWENYIYTVVNFDSVQAVHIAKNFAPPKGCQKPEYLCDIFLSNDRIGAIFSFTASWSYVLSNVEFGFSKFATEFKSYKGGKPVTSKKWQFRSECSKNYNIVYIMDFDNVVQVTTRSKKKI